MPALCFSSPIHLILDLPYYPWSRTAIFDFSWKRIHPVNFLFMRFPSHVFAFSRKPKKRDNVSLKQRITNSNVCNGQSLTANKGNTVGSNGDWLIRDHLILSQAPINDWWVGEGPGRPNVLIFHEKS